MAEHVVFVHIPKTGGSTFLSVLRRNFPTRDILLPDAVKANNADELARRLRLLSDEPPRRPHSIHGHVPVSYLDGIPGARFATLLRDPVRRQFSHYEWIYGKKRDRSGRALSIEQALARGRLIDNLQTRLLCGLEEWQTRPADAALLDAAIARLDRFAFVGFVERFAESMLVAKRRLGLRHVSYARRNVRGASHAPTDVDALRAHNELDIALYAHALARMEPELDAVRERAASLIRADEAMTRRRPVADPAALGYIADYAQSVALARARRLVHAAPRL